MQICVYVPEDSSSLFELRLKIRKNTVVFKREYRQYAGRFVSFVHENLCGSTLQLTGYIRPSSSLQVYWVDYSPQNMSEDIIAWLHDCVGAKVGSYAYDLSDRIGEHAGEINRQLIEGLQFDRLIVDIETLSAQSAYVSSSWSTVKDHHFPEISF